MGTVSISPGDFACASGLAKKQQLFSPEKFQKAQELDTPSASGDALAEQK